MRWQGRRESENVEDRRGARVSGPMKVGGGALLLIAVITVLLGGDPRQVVDMLGPSGQGGAPAAEPGPRPPGEEQAAKFVAVVLGDTEDTWSALFSQAGSQYQPPALVLFADAVDSACGMTSAAVGPFYCPADQKVYIDLGFFQELDQRFGAPGDFAQAYVVAHEIGHHVQNLLGFSDEVERLGQGRDEEVRRGLSVRLELQADCLAGVWGHHAGRDHGLLEEGDLEEGLGAAAAIGDDRMQRDAGRRVQPESFTHGSSEMRVRWFRQGLSAGRIEACNTFEAREL